MQTERNVVLKLISVFESEERTKPYASDRAGEVRALWWVLAGEAIPEPQIIEKLCAKYDGTLTQERPGKITISFKKLP
jgi:hypothetical protein